VFGGPVVVGAMRIALELLVRVTEQRHTVAAVENLGGEAVGVHVLESLDRVPTAGSTHRVATSGELFELFGRDAGTAETGWIERPQRLAHQKIAGLTVELVLQVGRTIAELWLHACRPQVRRFENVGIGGQNAWHPAGLLRCGDPG